MAMYKLFSNSVLIAINRAKPTNTTLLIHRLHFGSQVVVDLPARSRKRSLAPEIRSKVRIVRQATNLAIWTGAADANTSAIWSNSLRDYATLIGVIVALNTIRELEVAQIATVFKGRVGVTSVIYHARAGVIRVAKREGGDAGWEDGSRAC